MYSSSDVKGDLATVLGGTPTVGSYSAHANVWMFSTRLMIHLLPEESPVSLRLGFGPALVTRNGSAYKDSEGKVTGLTDIGGAVSLCSRIELLQNLGLRLRAEDYVYSAKLGFQSNTNPSDNFAFDSKTQHDFVFSAGLQLFINR